MKKLLFLFSAGTLLLSCHRKSENLAQKFKPIIDGVWVKSSYIKAILQTKSPYSSREKLGGVASMIIELPTDNADSTRIGYSLNNHEGSDFILYVKEGLKKTSLKTTLPDYDQKSNFYELGYSIRHKDTVLILYHYNKLEKLLDKTFYTRVAHKAMDENEAAWGIRFITNKILITGEYSVVDTTKNSVAVEFSNDGKVSGFPDFKTFYINTDFNAGPENNIDEIIFDSDTKAPKPYTFRFKSDSLFLYGEKHNADSTELITGDLSYKLVRQK